MGLQYNYWITKEYSIITCLITCMANIAKVKTRTTKNFQGIPEYLSGVLYIYIYIYIDVSLALLCRTFMQHYVNAR